jgi:hypothetical protein
MTGLNHALTGAAVAAAINQPALALPAALLSHFLTDGIPHWDYQLKPHIARRQLVMLADLALSLALLLFLGVTVDANPWLIIAGGLLGIAPDFMWLPYFISGKESKMHRNTPVHLIRRLHMRIQWSETSNGLFIEMVWFLLILWLIYRVHH